MNIVSPAVPADDHLVPPPRLFQRLGQFTGYTWDESRPPFHSSYDNWHVFGSKRVSPHQSSGQSSQDSRHGESLTRHSTFGPNPQTSTAKSSKISDSGNESAGDASGTDAGGEDGEEKVMHVLAKISAHALREERAFHICQNLYLTVDPDGRHVVKPIELLKLPPQQGDRSPLVVSIFQAPETNTLLEYIDFGPAGQNHYLGAKRRTQISLPTFLDFAIGATECLELLHHGKRIVHGEIRGDAFHFDETTGQVRLLNFGSGLRSFEHGLTSHGWSTLSKEAGAKTKLTFIAPEQTGRMPAEPDSRTDIYSLGILFWTLLTQQPAYDGITPMDIIQGVLGRRLPLVSSVRLDVPDVLGRIIAKMTAKDIKERYHSASGLRYDLLEVQKHLGDGNAPALKMMPIASKDVSSFFILPSIMIGRQKERDAIVKVIDKVSTRHEIRQKQDSSSLSSGSSLSDSPLDLLDNLDVQSDNTSSAENQTAYSGEKRPGHFLSSTSGSNVPFQDSAGSVNFVGRARQSPCNSEAGPSSLSSGPMSSLGSLGSSNQSSGEALGGAGGVANIRNKQKFKRKGRCEVISISGAGGLGKSCLVQSVQVEARRRGYFASSKFDTARRTPFGPVLKLLSSLFKQVFSERETETPFHRTLKQYVRPVWPVLHRILQLPEFLLGSDSNSTRTSQLNQGYNRSIRAEQGQSRPYSGNPRSGSLYSLSLGSTSSQDFLRAGSSTKSMRLMNTFLDVLRVFAQHKFLCLCLDDLQFADDESLELISQIIVSKMKIVLIVTYRPEEMLPEKIRSIIEPPEAEGIRYVGKSEVAVTRIVLRPLSEDDIVQYVSSTLCRPAEDTIPLAAVIQSKSAGNPFLMREMLDACNRKGCIYYNYRTSAWEYDLDGIFDQFATNTYHDTLNSDFITRRLAELPAASRSILAWASLIGTSFSFELIQRLLSGEFDYDDDRDLRNLEETPATTSSPAPLSSSSTPDNGSGKLSSRRDPEDPSDAPGDATPHPEHQVYTQQEIVAGLQAAIQTYIIIATEDDDRFRFAHDRYIQAAAHLKQRQTQKMHFVIACTLQKYYSTNKALRERTASHICASVEIIKKRVLHRQSFRKLLFDSAQSAAESGARPTAVKYYGQCFALLQDDPWSDENPDSYYDETLSLHIRAAECHHFMGHFEESRKLLAVVLQHAKTAVDQSSAWVLQSRMYAQTGNSSAAFESLRTCLASLEVTVDTNPTWDKCDAEFDRLSLKLKSMERVQLVLKPSRPKPSLVAAGAVLMETIADAFWSDRLTFYSTTLLMVDTFLTKGGFPQCGMAFMHLATVAISRFSMINFASELGDLALDLMEQWRDPYTLGRGGTIYSLFVGHVQSSVAASIEQLEGALEYTLQSGDRISTILNFGVVALLKLFSSEHMVDLESFCQFGCEEVPNWQYDCRGGTILIATRQFCRALQGKTMVHSADEVMCDESHDTTIYLESLTERVGDMSDAPRLFYDSLRIGPLFLYGHYQKAVDVGRLSLQNEDAIWSARNTRFTMLFHGLALAGLIWQKAEDPTIPDKRSMGGETSEVVKELNTLRRMIISWQVVNNVNYHSWSTLLDAQIAELVGDHGTAIKSYELSLDHSASNGFLFEEALGNHLLAGYFLRREARRSARSALREATTLFRQIGAIGVVRFIEEQHSMLLKGPTSNMRTIDAGCQTDFVGDSANVQYQDMEGTNEDERPRTTAVITETKGDRIDAWQHSSAQRPDAGAGLPALDMLDLTSILESSQVISSVLQVDELLKTMCEIILQNCGGLASLAAIIVEDEDSRGWSIAARGDPENGAVAHNPGLSLKETSMVASSVVLYCTRFRESVFLPDLMRDERFSNVPDEWWSRNPLGKSVIAIPIQHGNKPLLGVLYLEGQPNAFTDRNLTVLQLLVNQIGISYSNALTLKAIEKVSASNISMVESQKRALAKAKEAEAKSRKAEAEALRNVKLAEEAAKAKSIFLANVSHELRTPLNGVIGNSELLKDSDLKKEQAEMADSIRLSADLLLTVINDILDFSKMEADKMKLFIVAFNANEMLREVVRSVSYSNRDKRSSKDVKILEDISLPETLIYGDPVRLHQVIGNLIGNSLKFTENGSITVGARVDEETLDHIQLTFWVKDTGIGIPPSQMANLFKPFSQADASTARKYGGSGLGLSICKSLIESMMEGHIELESTEGVGTTVWFAVTFPKANPNATAGDTQTGPERDNMATFAEPLGSPTSSIPYADFSNISRDSLRVCIAEDNRINQKIAIQFVQKLGFRHVDAYDNGLAAVEGLRTKAREGTPYHLVLMDVQMPVLDGYEATKLIRKDPLEDVRGVLVIAMTASAIQGDREKCLESGMNDYLPKPVRVGVLKKKLEYYLQHSPLPNAQSDNYDGRDHGSHSRDHSPLAHRSGRPALGHRMSSNNKTITQLDSIMKERAANGVGGKSQGDSPSEQSLATTLNHSAEAHPKRKNVGMKRLQKVEEDEASPQTSKGSEIGTGSDPQASPLINRSDSIETVVHIDEGKA